MIEPQRAWVRPRVIAPTTEETLPLEDLVIESANRDRVRPIQILGGPGAGKTTALRHLSAVIAGLVRAEGFQILYFDEPGPEEALRAHAERALVVVTATEPLPGSDDWLTLWLAPWDEDDFLEYLLARHKASCGTVLAGLRETREGDRFEGNPELWTLTLDYLAAQQTTMLATTALRAAFHLKAGASAEAAGRYCLGRVFGDEAVIMGYLFIEDLKRFLRHVPLQQILAVDWIARDLAAGNDCLYMQTQLPLALVEQIATRIRDVPLAVAQVKRFLTRGPHSRHPLAASIVHQLDARWLLAFRLMEQTPLPTMTRAHLPHADWPGADLGNARLAEADLRHANLGGASLDRAYAAGTKFQHATLAGASMHEFIGTNANFFQADLSGAKFVAAKLEKASFRQAKLDDATFYRAKFSPADFTGASLVKVLWTDTDLRGAIFADADCTASDFTRAGLAGVDFRTTRIDGAHFRGAVLEGCNFEEVTASDADFAGANLAGALFTASTLVAAKFEGADLRNTGLAEIEWEEANLRNADLRGASFHLGSSRSGMVGSPIAREGSMTGFYTDDYTEQDFKSPAEIRKANLRGADLRGANIEGVDFYLVDLRGALYDKEHAAHLRACGAILEDRTH